MRNHEVTKVQRLLNEDGTLKEPGWSRKLYQIHDRNDIKKRATRIKEWDYYLVLAKDYGVAFTISDDGYIGLQSVSLLDFRGTPWEHTETVLNAFPMGKLKMPSTTDKGDVMYKDKRLYLEYKKRGNMRKIVCVFKNFHEGKTFTCDLTLTQPDGDTMVIATPWKEDKHAFYYNQKINCMRASGTCTYGSETYTFNSDTDFATLDWGRGVWTYDNYWYWGSGSGQIDGVPFGFNLGYGFGNTNAASENVIFYNGIAHKFDDIVFNISPNYTDNWTIKSSDGRFDMEFEPIIDRSALIDLKVIVTDQHQVFGRMNGTAVLDDGTKIKVKDFLCFAEKVHNKY